MNTSNQNIYFDLNLIYQERFGDVLFLIGTILAIISTYQAEKFTLEKLFKIIPSQNNSAYTIAAASWIFFIASIIFAYVAIARYDEVKSTDPNVSPVTLKGGEITAIGNIFKVIGFGLAAVGNQLKANSTTADGPAIISQ
ncbi:MAG: hypothetical protein GX434_02735 [Peptococcaceae bacterium]|nr:hypothetical protein [Peptococcaceae bacterium]